MHLPVHWIRFRNVTLGYLVGNLEHSLMTLNQLWKPGTRTDLWSHDCSYLDYVLSNHTDCLLVLIQHRQIVAAVWCCVLIAGCTVYTYGFLCGACRVLTMPHLCICMLTCLFRVCQCYWLQVECVCVHACMCDVCVWVRVRVCVPAPHVRKTHSRWILCANRLYNAGASVHSPLDRSLSWAEFCGFGIRLDSAWLLFVLGRGV